MPTNKVGVEQSKEFMSGYTPVYQPLYGLFLGKSKAYPMEAGTAQLSYPQTIADVRAKRITPKTTELVQIAATLSTRTFKKYPLANQFQVSHMQSQDGNDAIVSQVLDEHHIQMDELFLLGEGTSASNMINNSLFWSNDANYVLESSVEVAKDANDNYLLDLHNRVMTSLNTADRIAGRKAIIFYGTSIVPLFNSLHPAAIKPFKSALQESLGGNVSALQMPSSITPSGANGWILANLDQTMLHYTVLPELYDQGSNNEKMYDWYNFLMGSCMLEVLQSGGIVRQPATLAA